jgi:glycosyltransferase involved in cell wall biosynthesis
MFNKKIKLTLLGEGPLKAAAVELARDLEVECKFYDHEDQQDIFPQKMDFFILPSTFEGNSNALLEALIEGFPAITTPVGIASQLQKSGAPVIVTSGFGVEDFVKAIDTAIDEKERYRDIAKSFVNTIANAHSKQTIFTQWSSLLDQLSASPKGK